MVHCHVRLTFTDESRPMEGFIPAEVLLLNGTAGDNGTARGLLNQAVLGFLEDETRGGISSGNIRRVGRRLS